MRYQKTVKRTSIITLLMACLASPGWCRDAAKNIILVIGDGMGPQQVGLLLSYARQAPRSVIAGRKTAFDRMVASGAALGMAMTHPHNALVTDSAASASHLATGVMSGSEMIGLDKDGNPVETIVEKAMAMGKSTGLISDTRITHATPAGFAAHQAHRHYENEIAAELIKIGPTVMLSGGLRHFLPQEVSDPASPTYASIKEIVGERVAIKSKRKDGVNLLSEAKGKGYSLAFDRDQLKSTQGKILGLFTSSEMPDGIEFTQTKDDPKRTIPTLNEMASKALETLSQNPNGFFLMVEAGLIDWAAHYNDTGSLLHEMLKMNELLHALLDWATQRKDTLLIVTADHETGGFGFSYQAANLPGPVDLPGKAFTTEDFKPNFNFGSPEVLDRIYAQKASYVEIFVKEFDALPAEQKTPEALMQLVNDRTSFPITLTQAKRIMATEKNPFHTPGHEYLGEALVPRLDDFEAFYPYQWDDNRTNILAREVASRQSTVWATGAHTSTPVHVFALGPGREKFRGIFHHTDIGRMMGEILVGKSKK